MVSTTKKIRGIFLLAIIFIASIFIGIPTFAKNNVSNISIDVVVHDNGSATITQQWQGRFNEGTEVYLPIQDESLIIKNFKVSSEKHIWNLVKINDKWKHLNLTWDDPVTSDNKNILDYSYFLIDDDELSQLEKEEHNYDKKIYKK